MVRLNTDETSAYDKSSYWLHNVTYLKLRNLEVGYTFPKTWLNRTGISNLRLFVSGTNRNVHLTTVWITLRCE